MLYIAVPHSAISLSCQDMVAPPFAAPKCETMFGASCAKRTTAKMPSQLGGNVIPDFAAACGPKPVAAVKENRGSPHGPELT